ncbi:hypothetical protein C6Q13_11500 [Burkholderia gladioli]|nr:hypothetical protein C6Q13_11500 [Burkholderia gladioli]
MPGWQCPVEDAGAENRCDRFGAPFKRAGILYEARRSDDWSTLKCRLRQGFVIAVYTGPSGSGFAFGALLVGLRDAGPGELRYAGKFGTGFNETALQMILGHLKALETTQSPPANPARGYEAKGVHWVSPKLLVEVAYAQMTRESVVRHPVFHRLRTDNPP